MLNNCAGRRLDAPDARVSLSEWAFYRLVSLSATVAELAEEGSLRIDGDPAVFSRLLDLLDEFDKSFDIVC